MSPPQPPTRLGTDPLAPGLVCVLDRGGRHVVTVLHPPVDANDHGTYADGRPKRRASEPWWRIHVRYHHPPGGETYADVADLEPLTQTSLF